MFEGGILEEWDDDIWFWSRVRRRGEERIFVIVWFVVMVGEERGGG